MDDLKANTEYSGYSIASPVIQWFWEIVQGFSKEDKARFLQFVTGTSKVCLAVTCLIPFSADSISGFRSAKLACLAVCLNQSCEIHVLCLQLVLNNRYRWKVLVHCKESLDHNGSKYTKPMAARTIFLRLILGKLLYRFTMKNA